MKISRKAAARITLLFNSIAVSELMQRDRAGNEMMTIGHWDEKAMQAAQSLYREFGILAVGYGSRIAIPADEYARCHRDLIRSSSANANANANA